MKVMCSTCGGLTKTNMDGSLSQHKVYEPGTDKWGWCRDEVGMTDAAAIRAECAAARTENREITDGCARAIVAGHACARNDLATVFASTGAIPNDPELLWREIYPESPRAESPARDISATNADTAVEEPMIAARLRSYLIATGPRGPVAGWASTWVR